jgi:hypothetical protein
MSLASFLASPGKMAWAFVPTLEWFMAADLGSAASGHHFDNRAGLLKHWMLGSNARSSCVWEEA